MQVRIIELKDNNAEGKMIACFNSEEVGELYDILKSICVIKEFQDEKKEFQDENKMNYEDAFGIELNTAGITDVIGDWYDIEMILFNVPSFNNRNKIRPYFAVYVKQKY